MQVCNHPFGATMDMFQKMISEMFKELLNVSSIAEDYLIVGYKDNDTDHDKTVCRVVEICRKEIL